MPNTVLDKMSDTKKEKYRSLHLERLQYIGERYNINEIVIDNPMAHIFISTNMIQVSLISASVTPVLLTMFNW